MKTQTFGFTRFLWCSHLDNSSPALPVQSAQKNYRENRENGAQQDNSKTPFPSAGFDTLDIKNANVQDWSNKWPDAQGRYWWKLTLTNGQVVNDFYWMKDRVLGFPEKSNSNRYWFTVHHAPTNTKMEGFSQEPDYQKGFPDKDRYYWYTIQFDDIHCPAIRQWMEEKDFNYLKRIRVENPALFNQELAALKRDNPKHPAISKLGTFSMRQINLLLRILYQPSRVEDRFNLFTALPDELQLMVLEFVFGVKLTRDLFENTRDLVIQKEILTKPTTLDLSKRKGKQKATSQPVLNDDVMDPLVFGILYENVLLIQKLGEGVLGMVSYGQWRFEDVAVKRLHIQQMSENALIEFKQEAAIMARLRSKYIVSLRGICLTPYALVMEYMGGDSLFNLLHSQTRLPWPMRQQIALDMAKGLAFLHSHQPNKILHCNLKSQNVLLTRDQRAKLADFGLVKVRVESSRSQTYAQSSSKSAGTIPWMAPECLHHIRKYSRKSDMYAYGMVLWELTTRRIPYEKVTDPNEIYEAITAGEREKIPDQITNPTEPIPVSIRQLIDLCWLQAPKRRPEAKEAIEILEQPTQSQSSASQNASGSSSGSLSGFMSNLLSFKK